MTTPNADLAFAILEGSPENAQRAIQDGADPFIANEGVRLIDQAMLAKNVGVLRKCIEPFADRINESNRDRNTLLYVAAYDGHIPSVRVLVRNGGSFRIPNADGRTTYQFVAQKVARAATASERALYTRIQAVFDQKERPYLEALSAYMPKVLAGLTATFI